MNKKTMILILFSALILLSITVLASNSINWNQDITVASKHCRQDCKVTFENLDDINGRYTLSDKNAYTQNGRCKCEYLTITK